MQNSNTDNILAIIDSYVLPNPEDIALKIATDFRNRRVEKAITRQMLAKEAQVAISNITRFEQTGQISLHNLIKLAMALGYTPEVKSIFGSPKYDTMEELTLIRRNAGKKKAYPRHETN